MRQLGFSTIGVVRRHQSFLLIWARGLPLNGSNAKQKVCLWYPESSVYDLSPERLILPYLGPITNVTDERIRFLIIIP